MLGSAVFFHLLLSCSALRIQQKAKTAAQYCPLYLTSANCPIDYDTLNASPSDSPNPDSTWQNCVNCMCYLAGYHGSEFNTGGNTLGACGLKVQAKVATAAVNKGIECLDNYRKWGAVVTDTDSLSRGRWHTLATCLSNGVPVSARAIVNPTGVNPYWLDPIIDAAQVAQIQTMITTKKLDKPGSVVWEDCTNNPAVNTATMNNFEWVITCGTDAALGSDMTHMFDGKNMCCRKNNIGAVIQPFSLSPGGTTAAHCQAAFTAAVAAGTCQRSLSLAYDSITSKASARCTCNVEHSSCYGQGYNAAGYKEGNGGRGVSIYKSVAVCQ